MLRFDHETSAQRKRRSRGLHRANHQEGAASSERATADREDTSKRYGKKHNSSRERNSGVLRPITENSPAACPANSIHLSLQRQKRVGKSLIASILAQYFTDRCREIQCIDTDPVNRTLFQYKALNVSRSNCSATLASTRGV